MAGTGERGSRRWDLRDSNRLYHVGFGNHSKGCSLTLSELGNLRRVKNRGMTRSDFHSKISSMKDKYNLSYPNNLVSKFPTAKQVFPFGYPTVSSNFNMYKYTMDF